MRFAALALAGLLLSPAALAQDGACTNGTASLGGASYACSDVDLASFLPVGLNGPFSTGALNDIWGWTDPDDGAEYALVGTRSGTVFVDVSVPEAPRVLGKLFTQTGNSTWRDIKVYADHAFIVAEASGHGIQVFDLTGLRGLSEDASRVFTPAAVYTGIGKAHNIVMNETAGLAVAVGANESGFACNGGGLHMVDVTTPTAPTFAGCYDGDGYTHDAQCLRYEGPDADYQGADICMASNEDTITIVDVSDPSAPALVSKGFYSNPSYTHQNWLTDDGRYVIINDETDSSAGGTRTIVFDVQDLDMPEFAFFHFGVEATTDHNLYVRGDYVFQSNYESGLRILDASEIGNGTFTEAGFFDTFAPSNNEGFSGSWSNYPYFESGTVVVTDIGTGLFILKPADFFFPTAGSQDGPTSRAALSTPRPNPAAGRTELALTVDTAQAVRAAVYDVSGRLVATVFEGLATPGAATVLAVDGSDLPAGVYVVRVQGETFDLSRSLTLAR